MTAKTQKKPSRKPVEPVPVELGRGGKPKRRSPNMKPLFVVGGIDPARSYSLPEFMMITRMSRQQLSRNRRKGLVVRDTGVPTILGSDWLAFAAAQPPHQPKMRRPPKAANSAGHPNTATT